MSRVLSHAERAGIRYLSRSPQLGEFIDKIDQGWTGQGQRYLFTRRAVYWPVVRQAARDSREAPNMWRCVTCHRLMPFFLRRCKGCRS